MHYECGGADLAGDLEVSAELVPLVADGRHLLPRGADLACRQPEGDTLLSREGVNRWVEVCLSRTWWGRTVLYPMCQTSIAACAVARFSRAVGGTQLVARESIVDLTTRHGGHCGHSRSDKTLVRHQRRHGG